MRLLKREREEEEGKKRGLEREVGEEKNGREKRGVMEHLHCCRAH